MTQEEKLEEALKQTFPASDAFTLAPENSSSFSGTDEWGETWKRVDDHLPSSGRDAAT